MVVDAFIYERAESICSVRLEVPNDLVQCERLESLTWDEVIALKIWDGKLLWKV
jgi:hypothetical protein